VKPVSCNTYIKALNAFCLWLHEEVFVAERLTLPLLRFEKRIIVTLTDDQMHTLLKQKPKRFDQWRLHAILDLLLDSGLRIEEALTWRRGDLDLDNLLVTVMEKGRKERRVPFSFELRKVLFRYEQARVRQCPRCERLFPSRLAPSYVTPLLRTTCAKAATPCGCRWFWGIRRSRH
jgi:integrase/recombinase XerD